MPSSQRLARGSRKPEGGGPAGRAARTEDVEKLAVVARGMCDAARAGRRTFERAAVGRALESIVSDLGAAILEGFGEKWRVDEG